MRKVIIIGAGPAGIACADHLCSKGMRPVILEKEGYVGGLSCTFDYKGFKFDIGSHRFFTKNPYVLKWWHEVLKSDFRKTGRQSRIYYRGAFFEYPISIGNVIRNLGIRNSFPILFSYIKSRAFPQSHENNFEKWVVNRFGKRLYRIFFKEYTQKVWGMPCDRISSDWASQRIKGLSLSTALRNAVLPARGNKVKTLIKEFYYPRLGCGMMYETAAKRIQSGGGQVMVNSQIVSICHEGNIIKKVVCRNTLSGALSNIEGASFCSTMPLTDLALNMDPAAPEDVIKACKQLKYRSLVMVYLIIRKQEVFPDNWIYVNSNDVAMGRIANFKNWSREMVPDSSKTFLGIEYFCTQNDELWNASDASLIDKASKELGQLKLSRCSDVQEGLVVRVPNAYPVYENGYNRALDVIKDYVKGFANLHCMGRYGMFRYNNMDHSILTGILTAKNILGANEDIWDVNVDKAYHEELEGN